jgi:hypothetical protein
MISETASEKPRRGRPLVVDPKLMTFIASVYPEAKTRRGLQNHYYSAMGCGFVRDHASDLAWLWNDGKGRQGALVELGRITFMYDEEIALGVAKKICAHADECGGKLSVREAAMMLRRWRDEVGGKLGGKIKGYGGATSDTFSRALCAFVDRYQAEHRGLSNQDILDALNEVYCLIQEVSETASENEASRSEAA